MGIEVGIKGATAHQASFRDAVLSAYGSRCAISHLPAPRLPDVAHIIMDVEEQLGQPIVSNGLPLTSCLRSQRLCRRCDIPRLPGRRLTGCAIAETDRADADPPEALFRQAQSAKTPWSAPTCRSGSPQFQHRAALVQMAALPIRSGTRNA
jgi:hypothetical protein